MKSKAKQNHEKALRRARRTRAKVSGSSRPRLSVFRSAKHISVQLIDDNTGKTLVSSSDQAVKSGGKKPTEVAALVGADVAKKAIEAKIKKVVFDRGRYKYHGRVKAIAEAAREGGLEF